MSLPQSIAKRRGSLSDRTLGEKFKLTRAVRKSLLGLAHTQIGRGLRLACLGLCFLRVQRGVVNRMSRLLTV